MSGRSVIFCGGFPIDISTKYASISFRNKKYNAKVNTYAECELNLKQRWLSYPIRFRIKIFYDRFFYVGNLYFRSEFFLESRSNKGRLPTCPWSFWMKLGRKIETNMLITKIIFIFDKWTCGRSYRPPKSRKIRAAGPGFDREIWKGSNFDNQNILHRVFGGVESLKSLIWSHHLGPLGLKNDFSKNQA